MKSRLWRPRSPHWRHQNTNPWPPPTLHCQFACLRHSCKLHPPFPQIFLRTPAPPLPNQKSKWTNKEGKITIFYLFFIEIFLPNPAPPCPSHETLKQANCKFCQSYQNKRHLPNQQRNKYRLLCVQSFCNSYVGGPLLVALIINVDIRETLFLSPDTILPTLQVAKTICLTNI